MKINSTFLIPFFFLIGIASPSYAENNSTPISTSTLVAIGGAAVVGGGIIAAMSHHHNGNRVSTSQNDHITPTNDPTVNGKVLIDAIAAKATTGGTIFLGSGTYAVTSNFDIPSGITLIGNISNPNSVIITAPSTSVAGCSGSLQYLLLKVAGNLVISPSTCAASASVSASASKLTADQSQNTLTVLNKISIDFEKGIITQDNPFNIKVIGSKLRAYEQFSLSNKRIAVPRALSLVNSILTMCLASPLTTDNCFTNNDITSNTYLTFYNAENNQFIFGTKTTSPDDLIPLAQAECENFTTNTSQAAAQSGNVITFFNVIPNISGQLKEASCQCAPLGSQSITPTCDIAPIAIANPITVTVNDSSTVNSSTLTLPDNIDIYGDHNFKITNCTQSGGSSCTGTFYIGSTIVLDKGNNTSVWGGNCSGTQSTCILTVGTDLLEASVGTLNNAALSVISTPGTATTSNDSNIDCITNSGPPYNKCNFVYTYGTTPPTITLTNAAATTWIGCDTHDATHCNITMNGNKTITVH